MKIYDMLPSFLQESLITLYNIKSYGYRYAGKYEEFRNTFKKNRYLKLDELKKIQSERYSQVINKAITQSEFYKKLYENIDNPLDINNIRSLPIISKETIRNNIDSIVIKTNEKLITSKTGGTTGQSLIVKKRKQDIQERFAMLDDFRSRFGYELGKKTAWFSGKSLLTPVDIKKKRFWKTDHKHNVRYYSTFHIKEDYLQHYVNDLIKYSPEFLVGFPSSILEIAKYGLANGYVFPPNTVKAVFPTAETVTIDMRAAIESFFKTKIYDQYASSEGAPFITECESGCLHMELQSGVFEVLNDKDEPSRAGRLVITSFTSEATPLIRYDIGDGIVLEDESKVCDCGNHNPLVKEISGRIDDYIYSPQNGKINLGNVSNTTKSTKGIIRFQAIQNDINTIVLRLVIDKRLYNKNIEKIFIENWRERVGPDMTIEISYVDDIPVEKSGKYRIVKNNIKHLL